MCGSGSARRDSGDLYTGGVAKRLPELAGAGLIHESWVPVLEPVAEVIAGLGERLRAEQREGRGYLPHGDRVLRAFQMPLDRVRVLVIGQDPYPTPGHPVGLSFSVERDVRPIPRSLANIYREMHDDLGIAPAPHGDLTAWSDRGVMLLNRVLTVRPGAPASHRGWGWEQVTERAVRALGERPAPLVAVLWGRDAQGAAPLLPNAEIIRSAHPSPLSASRGFFGSRPFSRANAYLREHGVAEIDWRLDTPVQP